MQVRYVSDAPAAHGTELLALAVTREASSPSGALAELDAALSGAVGRALASGDMKGRTSDEVLLYGGEDGPKRVLLLGVGKAAEVSAEIVRQVQIERALDRGDHDAIIARAFEVGFGDDGLAEPPWIEADVIVCPGGLVAKSRTSHRCRFVSVDDAWVWDSGLLMREDKRSTPGAQEGFRAVALLPGRRRHGTRPRVRSRPDRRSLGRARHLLRGARRRSGRSEPAQRDRIPHALIGSRPAPAPGP